MSERLIAPISFHRPGNRFKCTGQSGTANTVIMSAIGNRGSKTSQFNVLVPVGHQQGSVYAPHSHLHYLNCLQL